MCFQYLSVFSSHRLYTFPYNNNRNNPGGKRLLGRHTLKDKSTSALRCGYQILSRGSLSLQRSRRGTTSCPRHVRLWRKCLYDLRFPLKTTHQHRKNPLLSSKINTNTPPERRLGGRFGSSLNKSGYRWVKINEKGEIIQKWERLGRRDLRQGDLCGTEIQWWSEM